MDLRILHFYPDLMSLYGSWGNLAILKRHLEDMGNNVTVESIYPHDEVDFSDADFIFMGAGTERSQKAALADFHRFGKDMREAAKDGVPMLFCGTAMQMLGHSITDVHGTYYTGVKVGDFNSVQGAKRFVGDVYGHAALYSAPIVGFMNSCTVVSGVLSPLLTEMSIGYGNEKECGPEGFHQNNVFASELTGPILVKNPPLLRKVISAIYDFCEEPLPQTLPSYPQEEESYRIACQELLKRSQEK